MKRIGICVLGLACAVSARAEVLTWKDSQGHVQFGDRPPAGADARPLPLTDPARLTPAGSDDTLARTLDYARRRDAERLREQRSPASTPEKTPASRTRSKKLAWRPRMSW